MVFRLCNQPRGRGVDRTRRRAIGGSERIVASA